MAFILPDELKTHLYAENIDAIARHDDTILIMAIDTAEAEAYGYLGSYDRDKIFSAQGDERNALLLTFVKDIAVWHFICICNAGVDIQLRKDRYEHAIAWLRAVQKSEIKPNLPILDDSNNDGKPDGIGEYIYGSNPQRSQHF